MRVVQHWNMYLERLFSLDPCGFIGSVRQNHGWLLSNIGNNLDLRLKIFKGLFSTSKQTSNRSLWTVATISFWRLWLFSFSTSLQGISCMVVPWVGLTVGWCYSTVTSIAWAGISKSVGVCRCVCDSQPGGTGAGVGAEPWEATQARGNKYSTNLAFCLICLMLKKLLCQSLHTSVLQLNVWLWFMQACLG